MLEKLAYLYPSKQKLLQQKKPRVFVFFPLCLLGNRINGLNKKTTKDKKNIPLKISIKYLYSEGRYDLYSLSSSIFVFRDPNLFCLL